MKKMPVVMCQQRWQNNIKIDLKERKNEVVKFIQLSQDRIKKCDVCKTKVRN
jgi:hypothetical protein